MKSSLLRTLASPILRQVNSLSLEQKLLRIRPTNHVLLGFAFNDSGFSSDFFYLECFALPLCVPTKHRHYTYGSRLRDRQGHDGWEVADPDTTSAELMHVIRSQGLPALLPQATPIGFARTQSKHHNDNPNALEGIAYSFALGGEPEYARRTLKHLFTVIAQHNPTASPWIKDIEDRAANLSSALSRNAHFDLLANWEAFTRQHLKVPRDQP